MSLITRIEGIDAARADKRRETGIRTTEDLLKECSVPRGRWLISEFTGLRREDLRRYTAVAGLLRIRGVGEDYAGLLEAGGVAGVVDLARSDAVELLGKLKETNQERRLVRQIPGVQRVPNWIRQAVGLPPLVQP